MVWEHVISFSDITAPPRWFFRTGLAYPLRARLEGSGAGAVRHCEFTTGAFVEPITVWDAPRRLAFDVIAQPPPLQEWSPYTRVYAPHLDGFFRTSQGEFRLVPLDDGRTRLEGRTWYTLDMQPAMYWTAIADTILHADPQPRAGAHQGGGRGRSLSRFDDSRRRSFAGGQEAGDQEVGLPQQRNLLISLPPDLL